MDMLPVSVIIPTHNRGLLVARAIDSVLSQTFKEYEIIVVDDGSTDDTIDILRRYNGVIRYVRQENQGPAAARNRGMREAIHEIVAFLDSDDTWLPEKLERQLPVMSDARVILAYTNWRYNGANLDQDHFSSIGLSFGTSQILDCPIGFLTRPKGSGIWTSTIICRKRAVNHVGGFDERMRVAEDLRLFFRLTSEGSFALVPQVLSIRGREDFENQLTKPSFEYFRKSATARLEVFMESYARAVDAPHDAQKNLRTFIADSLADQAKFAALDGNYFASRRRGLESLIYSPLNKSAVKAFMCVLLPRLIWILANKR